MVNRFNVYGMTCSACSARVEKAVSNLNGMKRAEVNLLTNSLTAEFDENLLSADVICQAIEKAGYSAGIKGETKKKEEKKSDEYGEMKKRFVLSLVFLIPLMYVAMFQMVHHMFGVPAPKLITDIFSGYENAVNFTFTQFILVIPILIINKRYFVNGFRNIIKRAPNMDSLIALGSSAAVIYGVFALYKIGYAMGRENYDVVMNYAGNLYFESAGMIVTLITLGKMLETKSKKKTGEAISKLTELAPAFASVIRGGQEVKLPSGELVKGDIIVVRAGESIPADGRILNGEGLIDQSAITGESVPVHKKKGDTVTGATINKSGYFEFEAERVGGETTLSQIIELVEQASGSKAPIAKLADKISGVFVPVVVSIAFVSAIVWLLLGMPFDFALEKAIAVLVISCPCALGLATPVAIMTGTGKAAENGVLIKSAEILENAHKINCVVLDKTGTVTEGKPVVTDVYTCEGVDKDKFLIYAASLEKMSSHPLAEAVKEFSDKNGIVCEGTSDFKEVTGKGLSAVISGNSVTGGNVKYMAENGVSTEAISGRLNEFSSCGKTPLIFAVDNSVWGIIAVADKIKSDSCDAINAIKELGAEVVLLTGDNHVTAEFVASLTNVDAVYSEVTPAEKEKIISKLKSENKNVAMVGDGINDAPALTTADVGIAIGAGTDIAIESADVVLMNNSLFDVVFTMKLSESVIKNIKMNLFWAFFYNMIGIPVAAGVLSPFGINLSPMLGAAAMSMSSVCVVTNALRLRWFKCNRTTENEEVKNLIKTVYVDGMSCNHCKMAVERVLSSLDGVEKAEVNLEQKCAVVELSKSLPDEIFEKAITDEGFKFVKAE